MVTKRKLTMIVSTAAAMALLVGSLPQAAMAGDSKRHRCLAAASKAVGHRIRAKDYRIVLGTRGPDRLLVSEGQDLICGFDGRDRLRGSGRTLGDGDIFIGGRGPDRVRKVDGGTFVGGPGNDRLVFLTRGRFLGRRGREFNDEQAAGVFNGGRGNDISFHGIGTGLFRGGRGDDWAFSTEDGRYEGGPGDDSLDFANRTGVFVGGAGRDVVHSFANANAIFMGGAGNDTVRHMSKGTFDGGVGIDRVLAYFGGTLVSVEKCIPFPDYSCP